MIQTWVRVVSSLMVSTAQNLNFYFCSNIILTLNHNNHYLPSSWITKVLLHEINSFSWHIFSFLLVLILVEKSLCGMMSGEVPAPAKVLKVPSLLHPQASHQRACGVAGTMATIMIAKYGKSGEAVDITRKRKVRSDDCFFTLFPANSFTNSSL